MDWCFLSKNTEEPLAAMWVFYNMYSYSLPALGVVTARKSAYLYALLLHDDKAPRFPGI